MMKRGTASRIDVAARRAAAAISRRESLLALGGAAVAAVAAATPLAAKSGSGGNGDKAKKACNKQGEQCRRIVISSCNGEKACIDGQIRCCTFFAECKAGPGFACFTD